MYRAATRSFVMKRWLVGIMLVCTCEQGCVCAGYSQDYSMIKLIEALSDDNRDAREEAVNALI
jgi:hypothetical protein